MKLYDFDKLPENVEKAAEGKIRVKKQKSKEEDKDEFIDIELTEIKEQDKIQLKEDKGDKTEEGKEIISKFGSDIEGFRINRDENIYYILKKTVASQIGTSDLKKDVKKHSLLVVQSGRNGRYTSLPLYYQFNLGLDEKMEGNERIKKMQNKGYVLKETGRNEIFMELPFELSDINKVGLYNSRICLLATTEGKCFFDDPTKPLIGAVTQYSKDK